MLGRGDAAGAQEFNVRGIWRSWDAASRTATIEHEEIAGYMPAMTMDFKMSDGEDGTRFEAGERVSFRLKVTDTSSSIDHLRRLSTRHRPDSVTPRGEARGEGRNELRAGDHLPNAELMDSSRQPLILAELRGEPFALTFIFTRCPLPNYCPLLSTRFRKLGEALQLSDGGRPWRMISVTVDPDYDTPEILKRYGEACGAMVDRWSLATGEPAALREFAAACGMKTSTNGTVIEHSLRTFVVGGDGRVRRVFNGNDWAVEALVDEMRSAVREVMPAK